MGGLEKFLFHPIVLAAFGTAMAVGLLVIGITFLLFKFLQKRLSKVLGSRSKVKCPNQGTLPQYPPIKCPFPCSEHKAMVDKVEGMDGDLEIVTGRQKTLREDVLPEKFVPRRDYETCQKDRKAHETELFSRVGALEREQGVGG